VRDAIVHYRNDSRSNGQVVVIGGSSGGSHGLYLAATGTQGYDMPDLLVMLSCGVSNLADPNQWALQCVSVETCPHEALANYLNIADPAPNPPTGNDLTVAQDASPTHWIHLGMCPFLDMCSSKDSLGIPTSTGFDIYSYTSDNMPIVRENGENGIVATALAAGLMQTTSGVPEANSFTPTIVNVPVHEHAFDYWHQVKGGVIPWISAPIPGQPTPTATPTASPTPTPTPTPCTGRCGPTPRPNPTLAGRPTPPSRLTPPPSASPNVTPAPRPTPPPRLTPPPTPIGSPRITPAPRP
jgi:hypothetical protein